MSAAARLALLLALALPGSAAQEAPWSEEQARALQRAQEDLRAGEAGRALPALERLLAAHPDSGPLLRLRGHALADLGRAQEARAALVAALARGELGVDVLARLVEIDHAAGRRAATLAAAGLLTLLEPEDAQWRRLWADLLDGAGEREAARVLLDELLAERFGDAALHERAARVALETGDDTRAARELALAWFLGAREPALARRLEALHAARGDARATLAWAARAGPTDDAGTLRRAETWLALEDWERAEALARPLAGGADGALAARAQVVLGRAALARGDAEGAALAWRRSAGATGLPGALARFVGAFLHDRGDFAEAQLFLEQARVPGPEGRAVDELVAACCLARGAAGEARAAIVRYLAEHGPDDASRALLQRLAALGAR